MGYNLFISKEDALRVKSSTNESDIDLKESSMSKIFVLDAIGAMSIEATRDLIETGGEHEYMLADTNLEKLEMLKGEYSDKKIEIMQVDATVFDEILNAIRGYDSNGAIRVFWRCHHHRGYGNHCLVSL